MKRLFLIVLSTIFLASGCAAGGHGNGGGNIIDLVNSANGSGNGGTNSASGSRSKINQTDYPIYDSIDIDLTTLNSTMVYSQVYNMLDSPNSYVNKIVKIRGPFIPLGSTSPDYCYPAILIQDATACCANGLEFLLYGVPRCGLKGGNGYPLYNEEATIVGRFETYLEDSNLYIHLVDAIWLENMETEEQL